MKSQVTTKTGDDGQSDALSGERYSKGHPIMECVGLVDEFRANLALLRHVILREKTADYAAVTEFLLWLAHACLPLGSACSDPESKVPERHPVHIGPAQLEKLEAEQARLEKEVALPKAFIASASNLAAAHADVTCTVARRLERNIVRLKQAIPAFDATAVLKFVNRLSDYLFILARYLEQGEHLAMDPRLLE
ncbi:MAG TPA: ATP:cob(I)alamin adenosyltransferase [Candidatus Hydrogenedentes bacterium]|nr:ATP:cob(I)alamin adenosyltransferase [Candidatus Hydrogenedentota bacterium]